MELENEERTFSNLDKLRLLIRNSRRLFDSSPSGCGRNTPLTLRNSWMAGFSSEKRSKSSSVTFSRQTTTIWLTFCHLSKLHQLGLIPCAFPPCNAYINNCRTSEMFNDVVDFWWGGMKRIGRDIFSFCWKRRRARKCCSSSAGIMGLDSSSIPESGDSSTFLTVEFFPGNSDSLVHFNSKNEVETNHSSSAEETLWSCSSRSASVPVFWPSAPRFYPNPPS